jgi:hypothetical protein
VAEVLTVEGCIIIAAGPYDAEPALVARGGTEEENRLLMREKKLLLVGRALGDRLDVPLPPPVLQEELSMLLLLLPAADSLSFSLPLPLPSSLVGYA